MWLRVSIKDKPVMINGDHVLRITEDSGRRARAAWMSRVCLAHRVPGSRSIDSRNDDCARLRRAELATHIISKAWQVLESALNCPERHDILAASISAGSSHFAGHGPVLTAAHACPLPIVHQRAQLTVQHRHLHTRILFAGITGGRLNRDRRSGFDQDLGVAHLLDDRMTRSLVAFVAFLGCFGANLRDEGLCASNCILNRQKEQSPERRAAPTFPI